MLLSSALYLHRLVLRLVLVLLNDYMPTSQLCKAYILNQRCTACRSYRNYHSAKVIAFWDTAPRSLVYVDRRFKGAYCHHHQDDYEGGMAVKSIRFNIPERCHIHTIRSRENLKSYYSVVCRLLNDFLTTVLVR
jgi:hypothetical protein